MSYCWKDPITVEKALPYSIAIMYSSHIDGIHDVSLGQPLDESVPDPLTPLYVTIEKEALIASILEDCRGTVLLMDSYFEENPICNLSRSQVLDVAEVMLCGNLSRQLDHARSLVRIWEKPRIGRPNNQEIEWAVEDDFGKIRDSLPYDVSEIALLRQALFPAVLLWAKSLSEAGINDPFDSPELLGALADEENILDRLEKIADETGVESLISLYFEKGLPLADVMGGSLDTSRFL